MLDPVIQSGESRSLYWQCGCGQVGCRGALLFLLDERIARCNAKEWGAGRGANQRLACSFCAFSTFHSSLTTRFTYYIGGVVRRVLYLWLWRGAAVSHLVSMRKSTQRALTRTSIWPDSFSMTQLVQISCCDALPDYRYINMIQAVSFLSTSSRGTSVLMSMLPSRDREESVRLERKI